MPPRVALVWAHSARTQGVRNPRPVAGHRSGSVAVRSQLDASWLTSSDCERPGRSGRLLPCANWSPRSQSRSIPLHASRTTASSPVRVLPPLTLAAPNQRLAFLLRKTSTSPHSNLDMRATHLASRSDPHAPRAAGRSEIMVPAGALVPAGAKIRLPQVHTRAVEASVTHIAQSRRRTRLRCAPCGLLRLAGCSLSLLPRSRVCMPTWA